MIQQAIPVMEIPMHGTHKVENLSDIETFHYDDEPHDIFLKYDVLEEQLLKANNCSSQIGRGSYGKVYEIPHTDKVLKVCSTGDLTQDGYHYFLEAVLTEPNLFFPIVDKFIKYRGLDNAIVYCVKMELLHPMHAIPRDNLMKIGYQLLKDFNTHEYDYYGEATNPVHILVYSIKNCYNRDRLNNILDPNLGAALESIKRIQKQHKRYDDMGPSNFMIRQTPDYDTLTLKYQLVITDPLS